MERYKQRRAEGFPELVNGTIRRRDGELRQIEYRACEDKFGEIWILPAAEATEFLATNPGVVQRPVEGLPEISPEAGAA